VPTDVEVGRDGSVFVSLLPGFPENPGAGQVWKINRRTGAMQMVAGGLVSPVDIALGRDGTIYVAELFASRISTITNGTVAPYMDIDSPGAIEMGRDGLLYVTTGVFGNGSVVKLAP
jgi:glucose/arabinose dehydrogenase